MARRGGTKPGGISLRDLGSRRGSPPRPARNEGRNAMQFKHLVLGASCLALVGASALATHAQAQEGIYVPLLTYRTGAFANSGIPIANGMNDYLSMLNERDGGIGGV